MIFSFQKLIYTFMALPFCTFFITRKIFRRENTKVVKIIENFLFSE